MSSSGRMSDAVVQSAPARRGLEPSRTVLDNGVVLLAKRTSTTPAVAMNLAVRAGSAFDPPGRAGLTWLLSRVIDRGTAARSAADIPDEHPYGRRTKGSIELVESLAREELLRQHAERFAPSELTAVVVGDVEPERTRDLVARVFGGWRKPPPPPLALPLPVRASARRR